MAAAAPGWNQFYLYQSPSPPLPPPPPPPPSSVSRNPPHAVEQPGEKLMCFPIMKWYRAKNKFKKVPALSPTAVQHSFNLHSGVQTQFWPYLCQPTWIHSSRISSSRIQKCRFQIHNCPKHAQLFTVSCIWKRTFKYKFMYAQTTNTNA